MTENFPPNESCCEIEAVKSELYIFCLIVPEIQEAVDDPLGK